MNKEKSKTTLGARLKKMLSELFSLEEVEVTFSQKGKRITYTYTKLPHSEAA